ncbi:MAG: low molecular weight protein arginine phosphatase [Gemmatimonadota bacterium]
MRILFVCTGNTCRSPLAEVIARRLIEERGLTGVTVASAGTSAWPDAPASDGALLIAMEAGLDLGDHRARVLSPDLVANADVVLAMGPHHLDRAEALGGTGKSWMLTAYASDGAVARPVSDPFGGDLSVYRATFEELTHEIGAVLDRVVHDRSRPT